MIFTLIFRLLRFKPRANALARHNVGVRCIARGRATATATACGRGMLLAMNTLNQSGVTR